MYSNQIENIMDKKEFDRSMMAQLELINELDKLVEDNHMEITGKLAEINNKLDSIISGSHKKKKPSNSNIPPHIGVYKLKNGKVIEEYRSIPYAARMNGIQQSSIYKCIRSDYSNVTAGGYQWKLKFK